MKTTKIPLLGAPHKGTYCEDRGCQHTAVHVYEWIGQFYTLDSEQLVDWFLVPKGNSRVY